MKACEQSLMQLDAEINQRMKGDLRATLSGDTAEPALELVGQDGTVLKFVGEPTPETLYGSAGETIFLEVAAKKAECSHPMIPNYQCLMVRERRYNEAGVQQPTQDKWHPLYQSIEGFEHKDGVRTVLRVKRYDWKNPPADAPSKGRRFGPLSGCPSAVRARACSCWTPALTPPCAGSQVVAHCGVAAVAGEIPLGERQVQPRRDHEGAEDRYVEDPEAQQQRHQDPARPRAAAVQPRQ
ncbi:hypothetical protein G6F22_016476 [Rhizopus arrhizus]|nr:hypothetical protein G6F22_016476 [Rhizopus arrhizus]